MSEAPSQRANLADFTFKVKDYAGDESADGRDDSRDDDLPQRALRHVKTLTRPAVVLHFTQ